MAQPANYDMKTPAQDARCLLTPLTGLFHGTCAANAWKQAMAALMQDRTALATAPVPTLIEAALSRAGVLDAVLFEDSQAAAVCRHLKPVPPPQGEKAPPRLPLH